MILFVRVRVDAVLMDGFFLCTRLGEALQSAAEALEFRLLPTVLGGGSGHAGAAFTRDTCSPTALGVPKNSDRLEPVVGALYVP